MLQLSCVTPPLNTHRTNKTNAVTLTKVSPKRDSVAFLFLISFPLITNSKTIAKIPPRGKMDNTREPKMSMLSPSPPPWPIRPAIYSLVLSTELRRSLFFSSFFFLSFFLFSCLIFFNSFPGYNSKDQTRHYSDPFCGVTQYHRTHAAE